jgi:AraC-like DNA-binding protein
VFDQCREAIEYANRTKTFGVYYSERQSPDQNIHVHECCEVLLCLAGGEHFLIDNRVYDVGNGDLFVINQFEAHKVTVQDDSTFKRFVLQIHPTFLYANSTETTNLLDCFLHDRGSRNKLSLSPEEAKAMTDMFRELNEVNAYGDDLLKKYTVLRILIYINQLFATHTDEPAVAGDQHRAVRLAIDYINRNYSQNLTLDVISKVCFVSVNQLCRLFRQFCGTTVSKYLMSKRITEAKKLLSSGRNVTDTAYLCGFNDYANFIRAFKKHVGISPASIRASSIPIANSVDPTFP